MFWKAAASYRKIISPETLASKAGVHLGVAKRYLTGDWAGISERQLRLLSDAAQALAPNFARTIVTTRGWIQAFLDVSGRSVSELAAKLGRSERAVRRWKNGNPDDIIPLSDADLDTMNALHGLQYVPRILTRS